MSEQTNAQTTEQTGTQIFNAGVAAAQGGQWGLALAQFEQAERLGVQHPKLRQYHSLTKAKAASMGIEDHSFWGGSLMPVAKFLGTPLLLILLGALLLSGGLLVQNFVKQKVRRWGHLAGYGISIVLAILGLSVLLTAARAPEGRVAKPMASLRSGPDKSFAEISQLPAGMPVNPTGEKRSGWTQVEVAPTLGQTLLGWIANEDAFLEESS